MWSRSVGDGLAAVWVGMPDRFDVKQKWGGECIVDEMLSWLLKSEMGDASG